VKRVFCTLADMVGVRFECAGLNMRD